MLLLTYKPPLLLGYTKPRQVLEEASIPEIFAELKRRFAVKSFKIVF